MTTIFSFPINEGWALVSDKLESDKTEKGYDIPYDIVTKSEAVGETIFGFAGNSDEIDKISEILKQHINDGQIDFDSFREIVKAQYGENLNKLNVELLFIDKTSLCFKIILNKINDRSLEEFIVDDCEQCFIGTGALKTTSKYQVVPILKKLNPTSIDLDNSENIIEKCVTALEIIARSDHQYTGHPAVYGCDIMILTQGKTYHYKVLPKYYLFKEIKETQWKNLEVDEND